jgi:hypothetical protein
MATEKRLIDANATFELLRSLGSRDYRRDKGTIMDAMKMISHPEYTPTVDAVEVIHGRWERMDTRYAEQFKCSVCRSECYVPTCMGEPMYDYCPNCGAKMDGDGNA